MSAKFPELGCYLLAGQPRSSRAIVDEVADAENLGLGTAFISERYNKKEAAVLCGAAAAASQTIHISTAATNHNTRHPIVNAGMARIMQDITGGRFTLGLGRGVPLLQDAYGIPRITTAQMEDFAGLMRRLFRGVTIIGHDGPAGSYPVLYLDSTLDEYLRLGMVAFAPNTLAMAGRRFDEVVLHTYFTDETTARCVQTEKSAAEQAGRDPADVKVWACLATVGDHIPYADRLMKTVGRLGTYLRGYGRLLVDTITGTAVCWSGSWPIRWSAACPGSTSPARPNNSNMPPNCYPTNGWPTPPGAAHRTAPSTRIGLPTAGRILSGSD